MNTHNLLAVREGDAVILARRPGPYLDATGERLGGMRGRVAWVLPVDGGDQLCGVTLADGREVTLMRDEFRIRFLAYKRMEVANERAT